MLSSGPVPGGSEDAGQDPAAGTPDLHDPLLKALLEIEAHVSRIGWDQPSRLFALAPTDQLIAAEPGLAGQLAAAPAGSLSSIEQDDFHATDDLLAALLPIRWGQAVHGVALATERSFLPAEFEPELPADPQQAARVVAGHPGREDIRVVVGVLRDGRHQAVARLAAHPEELLIGPDLVPALVTALGRTLI